MFGACSRAAMSGNDFGVCVDEDRHVEAEGGDAGGDLADVFSAERIERVYSSVIKE
jgi:hypothetical protein